MMKHRATLLVLSLALVFSVATKASAQAKMKIAYVDMRRALFETEDGKKAKKKLERLQKKLQTAISKREKSIMTMKEALEKQANVLTQEAMQKKAEEYYRSIQELQALYAQNQKELAAKEGKLTQDILIKMEKILGEIGRSDSYSMIYERATVAWAPAHLDLTDKLIQMYNAKFKKK